MNTNSDDERLKQIRERWAHPGALNNIFSGDIQFLLSRLDSQATTSTAICTCQDLSELERVYGEHYDDCPASTYRAATRMREACVAHLQATADALDVRQETECPSGTAFNSEAALRRRIATELESLTLTSPAVQMEAHNQHE